MINLKLKKIINILFWTSIIFFLFYIILIKNIDQEPKKTLNEICLEKFSDGGVYDITSIIEFEDYDSALAWIKKEYPDEGLTINIAKLKKEDYLDRAKFPLIIAKGKRTINENMFSEGIYFCDSSGMIERELEDLCLLLFEERLGQDYETQIFNSTEEANDWLDENTKIREDKTKTYEERAPAKIRYEFLSRKIGGSSVPFIIAIGDINSNNFDESSGLLCGGGGMVDIIGDEKDHLIYQITIRREWV